MVCTLSTAVTWRTQPILYACVVMWTIISHHVTVQIGTGTTCHLNICWLSLIHAHHMGVTACLKQLSTVLSGSRNCFCANFYCCRSVSFISSRHGCSIGCCSMRGCCGTHSRDTWHIVSCRRAVEGSPPCRMGWKRGRTCSSTSELVSSCGTAVASSPISVTFHVGGPTGDATTINTVDGGIVCFGDTSNSDQSDQTDRHSWLAEKERESQNLYFSVQRRRQFLREEVWNVMHISSFVVKLYCYLLHCNI